MYLSKPVAPTDSHDGCVSCCHEQILFCLVVYPYQLQFNMALKLPKSIATQQVQNGDNEYLVIYVKVITDLILSALRSVKQSFM